MSVHLSRKRNFAVELTDAKEMILAPEVTHRKQTSRSNENIERGPIKALSVTFPDGTIIAEKTPLILLLKLSRELVSQKYVE